MAGTGGDPAHPIERAFRGLHDWQEGACTSGTQALSSASSQADHPRQAVDRAW